MIKLKYGDIPDSQFDPKQLKLGVMIESEEHSDDLNIAKMIAKSHLHEFPNYYIELIKMENKLKLKLNKTYTLIKTGNGEIVKRKIYHSKKGNYVKVDNMEIYI